LQATPLQKSAGGASLAAPGGFKSKPGGASLATPGSCELAFNAESISLRDFPLQVRAKQPEKAREMRAGWN
jgi:hypothetical protein